MLLVYFAAPKPKTVRGLSKKYFEIFFPSREIDICYEAS